MEHRKHLVLGHYCWSCKINTKAGVPGFPRRDHYTAVGPKPEVKDVVWADGTHDDTDRCAICGHGTKCRIPVHGENYKHVATSVARSWDKLNPVV